MSDTDLSVCILTRTQPILLRQCVAACVEEIHNAGITGEIILIDNSSVDGYPRALADAFPAVTVVRNEENLGFSAANNKAIRLSRGRLVLILNDDAILQPGSLRLMLLELESDSKIAAVGPCLLNPDGSAQLDFTNKRFPHLRGLFCEFLGLNRVLNERTSTRDLFTLWKDPETSGETDHLAGACLLARRAALDSVNLFDERFYFWFDDTDLCFRLKKAGWRLVYLARAHVMHYGSSSFKQLSRVERSPILFESLIYYYRKNVGRLRCLVLRLTLAAAFLLRLPLLILRNAWMNSGRTERSEAVGASLAALRLLILG
ncbi:MAG TPA: glycosyltransferase family 2 protein [Terriglobia bacterium]|nr:glycosyltransferase family 2 protein [Terriglobia bacterium]